MMKKQLPWKAKAKESPQISVDTNIGSLSPWCTRVHSMPHPPLLLGQLPADTMLSFLSLYLLSRDGNY